MDLGAAVLVVWEVLVGVGVGWGLGLLFGVVGVSTELGSGVSLGCTEGSIIRRAA